MTEFVTIRNAGKIYKIRKTPYETDDKAYDRAWYIMKCSDIDDIISNEKETLSHKWANEKYYGMTYY